MTQRTQTVLIVTGVLLAAVIFGLVTGQLQDLVGNVGDIVNR